MKRSVNLLLILLILCQVMPLNLFCQTVLTAQVIRVSSSYIEINRGTSHGLKLNDEGVIYYMERVWERNEHIYVAKVRVISVTPESARLEMIKATGEITEGFLADLNITAVSPLPVLQKGKGGSKWWIWLIVAAAGGGIAVAVGGKGGGGNGTPPPTTGTITYDIPAN